MTPALPATSLHQPGRDGAALSPHASTKSRLPILRAVALQDDDAVGAIATPAGRFPRPPAGG